ALVGELDYSAVGRQPTMLVRNRRRGRKRPRWSASMKARTICLALWLLLLTRVVGAQIPQIEYRVGNDGTIRSVFTATTKPSCFLKPYGDEERPLEFAEDGEGTWS